MPATDKNFMRLALKEAKKAKAVGDLPFGAVIVREGKAVGSGHAQDHTTGDVTDHAEILAIREACRFLRTNNLQECAIYCSVEPCLMCAAAIFQAKIPKVIFGVSREDLPTLLRQRKFTIRHLAEDSNYKIEITRGILRDEILPLFD